MRTEIHKLTVAALIALLAITVQAATVVDFDADDISSVVNKSSDFLFSEGSATLDSTSSSGYAGQPVYAGFEEEGTCLWSANNRANAGLKVRWNGGDGVAGEASSGLYLFKQADFLNGLDSGSVLMDAANDTVSCHPASRATCATPRWMR